eukprot:TRINITY_DN4276_c0_g1_i1.p1 TRINITY_DN4276_c0_g1~~TRINITY_DN4276_c0_g1_i1.p1  ORF type:complete len:258 (+),score=15.23 TRINITY_DN4276_c0_g1_i1:74-847(+)
MYYISAAAASLVLIFVNANDLPIEPDNQWPVTIHYEWNSTANCDQDRASEISVHRPGICHPSAPGVLNSAVVTSCNPGWTLSAFADDSCTTKEQTLAYMTPGSCQFNAENRSESHYCFKQNVPANVDGFGAAGDFRLVLSKHGNDDECNNKTLTRYHLIKPDVCLRQSAGASARYIIDSAHAAQLTLFASPDCTGDAMVLLLNKGSCQATASGLYVKLLSTNAIDLREPLRQNGASGVAISGLVFSLMIALSSHVVL